MHACRPVGTLNLIYYIIRYADKWPTLAYTNVNADILGISSSDCLYQLWLVCQSLKKSLSKKKKSLSRNVKQTHGDPPAIVKVFSWTIHKYNHFCSEDKHPSHVQLLIMYWLSLSPKNLIVNRNLMNLTRRVTFVCLCAVRKSKSKHL